VAASSGNIRAIANELKHSGAKVSTESFMCYSAVVWKL
jgi:hypothetical protein